MRALARCSGDNPNTGTAANNDTSSMNSGSSAEESNPRQEAREVRQKLDQARNQGKDVSCADHHYRLAMRDLRHGDNTSAMHHFEQAENQLGTQENNETTNPPAANPPAGNSGNPSSSSNMQD
jgi:hypothetical protein